MKKVLFTAVAAMFAVAATAQNRAIDALVEKYTDTEGLIVVDLKGEAVKGLSSMIADGEGTIDVGDGQTYDMSELLSGIEAVTALVAKSADGTFVGEVRDVLDSRGYSTVVSVNEDDNIVRIKSAEIRNGKYRGNTEVLVMVVGDGNATVLVRLIGDIDTQMLASLIQAAQKKS